MNPDTKMNSGKYDDEELHQQFMDRYHAHKGAQCPGSGCEICEEEYNRSLARNCIRCGIRYGITGEEGSTNIHLTCKKCDWMITQQCENDKKHGHGGNHFLQLNDIFKRYCEDNQITTLKNIAMKLEPKIQLIRCNPFDELFDTQMVKMDPQLINEVSGHIRVEISSEYNLTVPLIETFLKQFPNLKLPLSHATDSLPFELAEPLIFELKEMKDKIFLIQRKVSWPVAVKDEKEVEVIPVVVDTHFYLPVWIKFDATVIDKNSLWCCDSYPREKDEEGFVKMGLRLRIECSMFRLDWKTLI